MIETTGRYDFPQLDRGAMLDCAAPTVWVEDCALIPPRCGSMAIRKGSRSSLFLGTDEWSG